VNQKVASKQLKQLGYDTKVANNGLEALELLEKCGDKIDLILMDCQMPICSGYDCSLGMGFLELRGNMERNTKKRERNE
jgi:CheY-like chemotaxis protein